MVDGATKRSEELGWTIDVQAPASEGDFASFVTTVQQLLEKGVEAISIMGVTVVDTMNKIFAGEEVPQIILTPSVVVSPDNLQDYLDGKLWTEPVAGFPELDNDLPTVPEE